MNFMSLRQRLLRQRRFRHMLLGALLSSIALGLLIVPIESQAPAASITNNSDGLWWAFQTITTVGYGDVVPVTDLGRFLGIGLQLMGAVMFGVLIAMIGSNMNRGQEEFYWNRLFERLNAIDDRLNNLEKGTKFLVNEEREELEKLEKIADQK